MRTENTFSIDFIVRKQKKEKHCGLLYARVTLDRDVKEISLKQKLLLSSWDNRRKMVKAKNSESKKINARIESVRFRLMDKYRMLQDKEEVITADKVKEAYLEKQTIRKCGHTLLEAFKIKQIDLGLRCNGWSQQQISKLEQMETIDDDTLDILAMGLGVTIDFIKNFKEEKAIYNIQSNNTFNDSSSTQHYQLPLMKNL
ncbi:helix-turn-helix domain-containing protein [Arachidicoccus sp.]|uniref:helix-turn-helix domain-containing protein n=1 Tax=Arachidicoccus sp. TaxID=1872624 RepID=UPI003D1CFFC0